MLQLHQSAQPRTTESRKSPASSRVQFHLLNHCTIHCNLTPTTRRNEVTAFEPVIAFFRATWPKLAIKAASRTLTVTDELERLEPAYCSISGNNLEAIATSVCAFWYFLRSPILKVSLSETVATLNPGATGYVLITYTTISQFTGE